MTPRILRVMVERGTMGETPETESGCVFLGGWGVYLLE